MLLIALPLTLILCFLFIAISIGGYMTSAFYYRQVRQHIFFVRKGIAPYTTRQQAVYSALMSLLVAVCTIKFLHIIGLLITALYSAA